MKVRGFLLDENAILPPNQLFGSIDAIALAQSLYVRSRNVERKASFQYPIASGRLLRLYEDATRGEIPIESRRAL
jgi:hypothetical protein